MSDHSPRIHRYEVPVDDGWHQLTLHGHIGHIATRTPHAVEIWAVHDPGQAGIVREFRIYGTGHPLPPEAVYIGTALVPGVRLVWHLMERPTGPGEDEADE